MKKKSAINYSLHVVIADDDQDERQLLSQAIEGVKVKVDLHKVENGEKLMHYLDGCNGDFPDLLFLDLNIPRKTGLECLTEIRTNPKFKDTMIAIYSTSSAEQDIDTTFSAGANIYITKPNDYESLKKIVADVLLINWQYHTAGFNKKNFVMLR